MSAVVIIVYLLYFLAIGAVCAVTYFLTAFGIFTISKKLGISGGWRGFLPVFDMYQLGKIADEDQARYYPEKKPTVWRKWMLLAYGSLLAVSVMISAFVAGLAVLSSATAESGGYETVFVVGIVLLVLFYLLLLVCAVAMSVVQYIVLYKVFHVMMGEHAVWLLILCIFVSGALPVVLFVLGIVKKFPLYTPEARFEDTFSTELPAREELE